MRIIEILLLVIVVVVGAIFSITLRNTFGLSKIVAIPLGTLAAIALVGLALYMLTSILNRGD